ncbi:transporter [Candidatus Nitrosoglobus terrae]|uniref:Transporter n=1 Tax=Candidatus Nitrosoglobus terrae TaxID=1630141 RepID=A0A1Q2SL36_9GAMM|nr:DHA2 family efflux MFS transporter permease subunit [Candidatus Nitrosoglobus terrae]BAW79823.1 transporter [Candidatus Nitrosoglobus terrae]
MAKKASVIFSRRLRGWRFFLLNIALCLGNISILFSIGSYVTIQPHVAGDLEGVLVSFATWSQTDFIVSLALSFPIGRTLAERYGNYRVYVAAFILFAIASCLCAISDSFIRFLWARLLLGFFGGLAFFLGQELLINEYPNRLKVLGLAIWGILTVAPLSVAGPIGGWFADEMNWRYLFYLNTVVSLIVAGTVGSLLYQRGFKYKYRRFDFIGFILYALFMGGIAILLTLGSDFDWLESPFLRKVVILTFISLVCFIIWEIERRHPLIDLKLFMHRNFTIGVLCLFLGFFAIQGLAALLTVQLQVLLDYSSTLAAQELATLFTLSAPTIAIMHILTKRMDARILACFSFLGLAIAFYWIGFYDDPASFDQIRWPLLFEGIFIGAFFAPPTAIALHGLAATRVASAAEIINVLRFAGGGFGIASQTIVVYRRAPYHQLHLADYFGGRFFPSVDVFDQFSSKLMGIEFNANAIVSQGGRLIRQLSGILAVDDAFILGAYTFLGLAILVWFAYPTHLPIPPSPKELEIEEAEVS